MGESILLKNGGKIQRYVLLLNQVFELTTENWEENVGRDKYVVVKFYTRWCHYCRLMAPEYDKLFDMYKDVRKDLVIARLEGSVNEDISNKYGIYSFPIIVLFKPNDLHGQGVFQGNRVANFMKIWIDSNIPEVANIEEQKKIDNSPTIASTKNETTQVFEVRIANKSVMTDEFEFFGREVDSLNQKIKKLEHEMQEIKKNFSFIDKFEDLNKKNQTETFFKENKFKLPSLVDVITYLLFLLILIALYLTVKRILKMKNSINLPIHSKV